MIQGLGQLLADYQIFYTNLRGYHWNIKGEKFFELHLKFEELYNDVAIKIDELAERILMLGGLPENRYSEYLKQAHLKEVSHVSCGNKALKDILYSYGYLIGLERQVLSHASKAGDESTVATMSDYIKNQEKLVWMLVAYQANTCDK